MSSLKQKLADFFTALIPVQRRTIYDHRTVPAALASFMDVDRIHSIFTEAEGGNTQSLFALYRDIVLADSHLQGEFGKRKLAVLGDVLTVQPADKKMKEDVKAAEFIRGQIEGVPNWLRACAHLLDATLWPVAVLEKVFVPDGTGYRLRSLVPVPDQLLDFSQGRLMIRCTDPDTGYVTGHLCDPDESRYIVHRGHLLGMPDNWGGPMRCLVFWWFFSAMDRDSWARFIDRFGSPFLVGKYDQGDDQSRTILERAFSNATRLFGIVISRDTEVEIQQAAAAPTGQAFELFLSIAQREKSKLIVGQTTSAEAQPTGLGSGVATQQEGVRQDIRSLDVTMLRQTLQDQLIAQIMRINGIAGRAPRLVWGAESKDESGATAEMLASLARAGLEIADESLPALSDKLGYVVERSQKPPAMGLNAGYFPLSIGQVRQDYPFRAQSAMDQIARGGSADLSRAFRATFAPLRRIVLESTSVEDLESRLHSFTAEWNPADAARVIEEALTAFTANGATLADR